MSNIKAKEYLGRLTALGLGMEGDESLVLSIVKSAKILVSAIKKGNKVLIFGNGGSAAEAQHFSAELVGRFGKSRRAIPSIALNTDSSIVTAQANDGGFETIFSRQIEAYCKKGDVLVALTTSDVDKRSGHSVNISLALKSGKLIGAKSIGLFSSKTKELLHLVDVPIIVAETNTALIQVAHLHVIHFLCLCVEDSL